MASVENKNIIEVSDADPFICRNINIHSVYSFQSILIRNRRWFWLPPSLVKYKHVKHKTKTDIKASRISIEDEFNNIGQKNMN